MHLLGGGVPPPFPTAPGGGVPPPFPTAPGAAHAAFCPSGGPPGGPPPGANFLSLFGSADLSLQEIADKAQQLQQKMDENAEHEKASLRAAAEQKYLEIERHAAELTRHAASSIEAYKTSQLQAAERQKAYEQAVVRQQAEQAKHLIDQQAAQAIAAVETRDRQQDLQRQQKELAQDSAPPAGYNTEIGMRAQSPMSAQRDIPNACMAMMVPQMAAPGPPPHHFGCLPMGSRSPVPPSMMARPSTPPHPMRPMVPAPLTSYASRPTLHGSPAATPPHVLHNELGSYNMSVPRLVSPDGRSAATCEIRPVSPSMSSRVLAYPEHPRGSDAAAVPMASIASAARPVSPGVATRPPTYIEPVTYSSSALTAHGPPCNSSQRGMVIPPTTFDGPMGYSAAKPSITYDGPLGYSAAKPSSPQGITRAIGGSPSEAYSPGLHTQLDSRCPSPLPSMHPRGRAY